MVQPPIPQPQNQVLSFWRGVIGTALPGLGVGLLSYLGLGVAGQATNDPSVRDLCQVSQYYTPFLGALVSARSAFTNADSRIRRYITPLAAAATVFAIGVGTENVPPHLLRGNLGDVVESSQRSLGRDYQFGDVSLTGTQVGSLAALIATGYIVGRRRRS